MKIAIIGAGFFGATAALKLSKYHDVDLFEKKGLLTKSGNRLKYIDEQGKEHLEYRKAWTGEKLELIMQEISNITPPEIPVEEVSTVDVPEGE